MGLAGQKIKQRIGADPNNLHWSNDQSKFGFRMLQKMGWAPGKGLGAEENGSKEHIKIKLKDNTLGLGATTNHSEDWLNNTDAYSRLLANLNNRTESPDNGDDQEEKTAKRKAGDESDDDKRLKKKEKRNQKDKKKKKDKKDKKDKKEKNKTKKEKKTKKDKEAITEQAVDIVQKTVILRNAARAKFRNAKRLATTQDPTRLNEILGIKPSTAATA